MEDLDTLDRAIGIDIGSQLAPAAQSIGRLLIVLVIAAMVLRLVRRAIRRVEDNRFREQLLFFVPKGVGVIVVIIGLAAIGIDVSGMAARSAPAAARRTRWPRDPVG